jgi:ferredoxin
VECPIGAIFEEDDVPEDQKHFIALNAELAKKWADISIPIEPMVDHEKWDGVENKFGLLVR